MGVMLGLVLEPEPRPRRAGAGGRPSSFLVPRSLASVSLSGLAGACPLRALVLAGKMLRGWGVAGDFFFLPKEVWV